MINLPAGFDYTLLINDLLSVGSVFFPLIGFIGAALFINKLLKRF